MRVLTFNSHQPYVHLLATALPVTLGVVQPRRPSGELQTWDERIRPLPDNVRLFASVEDAARASRWEWVVAHNVHDLLDARELEARRVFVVHGTLTGRLLEERSEIRPEEYRSRFAALLGAAGCRVVYISELKRRDWGLPGKVIRPCIDTAQYRGYRGDQQVILRVCHHLRERGAILGWQAHEEVCRGLPSLVLGRNPGLAGSRLPESWDDLREAYRSCRVYLSTALHPFEDGYNLALLEAMATGMPVAALRHPTLPVRDGVEGVVAPTATGLRERVVRLLGDPEAARVLGHAARRRVEREFPLSEFRRAWTALLSA